jgi:HNH endonuclease
VFFGCIGGSRALREGDDVFRRLENANWTDDRRHERQLEQEAEEYRSWAVDPNSSSRAFWQKALREKEAELKAERAGKVLLVGKERVAMWSRGKLSRAKSRQTAQRVNVSRWGENQVWWYRDSFFAAAADLDADDVVALAHEQDNRKRLRLEKAHALQAMQRDLDTRGRRQPIPQEIKVAVWQRDGGRCVECGSQEELEFDHVIPLAMGGANTERNLQLLCAVCNRRKGATLG